MTLNRPALKKFRVNELKALIKKYDLGKVGGNKSTLISRIGSSKKWNEIKENESIPIRKKKVFSKKQLEAQQRFSNSRKKAVKQKEKNDEITTENLDIQAEQELTKDERLQLEEDQAERNKVVKERDERIKQLLKPKPKPIPLLDISIKKNPLEVIKPKLNFVEFIKEKREEINLMKENNKLRDINKKIVELFN